MARTPEFDAAFERYVEKVRNVVKGYYEAHFPNLTVPPIEVHPGRRYMKVVKDLGNQKTVHSFVDTTNGDVLKPATWRSPAKHARGNIYSDGGGQEAMAPDGHIRYLG